MWKESLFLSYGQLRAIVAGTVTDADSISNETVTNGEWQHVAMTFNVNGDKKIRLYINGHEVNSYSRQYELEGSVQSTASYDFLIGSDQWNSYWFDGMIDEVKIYEKALSEQKIFDEYATVFCAELDEKGGSTVHDLHGITGSISGAGWVTGLSGSALSFDGIDDNVDFGNPSALDLNGSRTISAWIKPDTKSPYKCIVSKSIWKASLFLSYGQLRAIVGGTVTDADSISNETVTNGEWQHVAMTFDVNGDKKIHLYINGQEVNSYSRQYTLEGSVASTAIYNFSIGSDHGTGYWFDGAIDKVKIFNIPLSTQEIFAQYKDSAIFSASIDEGSGSSVNDSSIHENTGVISGATWATGLSGSALDFDGIDDNVDFGSPSVLDLTGSRTMSAWIKSDTNSPYKCIVAKSMWKSSLFLSYGKLRGIVAGTTTDADSISNETVTNGTWHHVVMAFDANGDKKVHLYLDGQEVTYSRQYQLEGFVGSAAIYNFSIGSDHGTGYWFDGMIDEVNVYSRALSGNEISNIYLSY
jgi:major membrane immunogen (membrane-anchored lipoprotein)